jgi:hypothetical protein
MENELKTCVYLDDIRTPKEDKKGYKPWIVVRNYDEFCAAIDTVGMPDFISFDHDLATEHMNDYYAQVLEKGFQEPKYEEFKEKTGLDCAKYLVEYSQSNNIDLKTCAVHSHNPVGAHNIQSYINGYKKHCKQAADCFLGQTPFFVKDDK